MSYPSLSLADYLKSPAYFAVAANPGSVDWSERGVESEIISPLYDEADAIAEAARQAAFLAGPLVEDVITVAGQRKDLMLKTITAKGSELGYDAGKSVFVIGFDERDDGRTDLRVLRSLSS